MTNKEAIEMFKAIMKAEIERIPSHYDAEVDDDVYDDTSRIEEILELNKIVCEALEKADKYRWHDLRENPDDLPVLNIGYEYVEVITAGDNNLPFPMQYDHAVMKYGEWNALYDASSLGYLDSEFKEWNTEYFEEIIAWRYIEPLEDGEEE